MGIASSSTGTTVRRRLVQDVHTYLVQDSAYTQSIQHNTAPQSDDPLRHFGRVWPDAMAAGWTLKLIYSADTPIYLAQAPTVSSYARSTTSGRSVPSNVTIADTTTNDNLTRLNYGGIIIHVPVSLWLKYP